ncbi:MAG: DUF2203 domain-containing protein [Bdellovibrionota bacterium]
MGEAWYSNLVSEIISLNSKSQFTLNELENVLPYVYRITDEAQRELRQRINRLDALPQKSSDLARKIESEIDDIVEHWEVKVKKLGGIPKGVWLVDFDSSQGYYCWKFPETQIKFFHGYQEGFSGRKPLDGPKELDV